MKKKALSLAVKCGMTLLTLCFISVVALILLVGYHPAGEKLSFKAINYGIQAAQNFLDGRIQVGFIEKLGAYHWRVNRIQVDTGKPYSIESIEFSLSPIHLLYGKFLINDLTINGIKGAALPEFKESKAKRSGIASLFPLSFEVEAFHIRDIEIEGVDQWVKRDSARFTINGGGEFTPNLSYCSGYLNIAFVDAPNDQTSLSFLCYHQKDHLVWHAVMRECGRSILSSAFESENPLDLNISLNGKWSESLFDTNQFVLSCDHFPIKGASLEKFIAKGSYSLGSEGRLEIENAQGVLKHPQTSIGFKGAFSVSNQLEIENGRLIGQIQLINTPFESDGIIAEVLLKGLYNDLHLEVKASSAAIEHETDSFKNVKLSALGKISPTVLSIDNLITFDFESIPVTSSFSLNWDYDDLMRFDRLRMNMGRLQAGGDLSYSLAEQALRGQINSNTFDLAQFFKGKSLPVTGKGSFNLIFDQPQGEKQYAHMQVNVRNFLYGEMSIGAGSLVMRGQDLFTEPFSLGTLKIENLKTNGLNISNLLLESSLGGNRTTLPFHLQLEGVHGEQSLSLTSDGTVRLLWPAMVLAFDSIQGKNGSTPLLLKEPFTAAFSPIGLTSEPIHFHYGSGMIKASGNWSSESLDWKVEGENLDIHLLPNLQLSSIPTVETGEVNFTSSLSGHPSNPEVRLTAKLAKTRLRKTFAQSQSDVEGSLDAFIHEGKASVFVEGYGLGKTPIRGNAEMPFHLSLMPWRYEIPRDEPISLKLEGEAEISPFLKLLSSSKPPLSGTANVNFSLSGTFDEPKLNGHVLIIDGTYESLEIGCLFNKIDAEFVVNDHTVEMVKFAALDTGTGSVQGKGLVKLVAQDHYPFEFHFTLNKAAVLRKDFFVGIASGQACYRGNSIEQFLEGKLVLDNAMAKIPKKPSVDLNALDVTFVNDPKGRKRKPTQNSKSTSPLHLQLSVDAPGKIFATSKELHSEWGGHLDVKGTSSDPLIYGRLRCLKGDYRIRGKSFWIERGNIQFDGNLEKKTTVFVSASHDIDRVTIEALLKGPIKNPNLTFRSNPPMSQKEIFSKLLFNTSAKDTHAFDDNLPQNKAIDINSADDDEGDMFSRIQQFGIDRIEFDTQTGDKDNQISVNIGKYLTRGIYVSLRRGISRENHRVCVEAKVIPHIKIQAEVDDERAGRMLLMWKHDY